MSRKGQRTPEEREAARRERARRRAEREGRPFREEPAQPAPPSDSPSAPFDPDAAGAGGSPSPPFDPDAAGGSPSAPFDPDAAGAGGSPSAPFDPDAAAADPVPPAPEPAARYDAHAAAADPVPPAPEPPAAHEEAAASQADPHATQQWDVSVDWTDEPADVPSRPEAPSTPPAADLAAGPPIERGSDPEPMHAHDESSADPDATCAHDTLASDPDATRAHDATRAQSTPGSEVPLGTKRVSGQRPSLAHLHRPGRGTRREGGGGSRRPRVRRPGELGPPRRRTTVGGRIAGGIVVLLAIVLGWFLISLFQPFGAGEGSGRVVVNIPSGSGAGDIGKLLADRGVVDSGFFFNLRATVSGDRGDLKSGRFTFRREMSYAAALDVLTADAPAPPPMTSVTIPEGRSRRETGPLARRAGLRGDYFAATRRSAALNPRRFGAPANATLEGFLFPATYELRRGARVQRLVDDQLAAFKRNFRTVDLRYARSKNLDAYDVLTIASMIEREVSLARERPLVAAVIYNRLSQGIPLGIDATLRYEQGDWVNPLKRSVLERDTPFNTRIRAGLPPGPIGSPGLASIKAAARPARVGYVYYVVDPCKNAGHVFANTYDEHLANVARYDTAREAAGGRGLKCGAE